MRIHFGDVVGACCWSTKSPLIHSFALLPYSDLFDSDEMLSEMNLSTQRWLDPLCIHSSLSQTKTRRIRWFRKKQGKEVCEEGRHMINKDKYNND
ncbi:unnamed protein product [Sphenostylis stenocarpa]|uniref:Uncharacterized protein n=1 Tax=Sphenostylis stenocarpa TaxID=92480 RepID=A0AA86VTH4_9FABA|nr:unnamed protein product [Sphenostylis stenocarpa]